MTKKIDLSKLEEKNTERLLQLRDKYLKLLYETKKDQEISYYAHVVRSVELVLGSR